MRLIDADKAKEKLRANAQKDGNPFVGAIVEMFCEFLDQAPTVEDVTPVVHGRWCVGDFGYLNCSVCGKAMYTATKSTKGAELVRHHWKPFCPHCGAKMDADIHHDTADRCVCCGDVIPEGWQVCPGCEGGVT